MNCKKKKEYCIHYSEKVHVKLYNFWVWLQFTSVGISWAEVEVWSHVLTKPPLHSYFDNHLVLPFQPSEWISIEWLWNSFSFILFAQIWKWVDNISCKNYKHSADCPPQLVPVPGESGAQYKYCSPSAPLNDQIQGCGANRHCQFSTNLERSAEFSKHFSENDHIFRYICCGLESDVRLPNVCPPQPANLVPVELAGNYRTCNPWV